MNALHVRGMLMPLLAAASLLAFGCASPPEAEKKAAESAVGAAKTAGAEKYAAREFAAVTAALRKAESEMSNKAYKEAKASYESVKDLAEKATKAAESGKAAVKADAERQLGEISKRWEDLQVRLEVAARKLKPEQRKVWEADGRSVGEGLQAAKDTIASDASAAKAKLAAVAIALDKWEADLAAMAQPAPKAKK